MKTSRTKTPPQAPETDAAQQRRREILETAAKLICKRGFDATGVQDIAEACGLTKAGLYHHIGSKDGLLEAIMDYGMDLFEEAVLAHVSSIADPLERLKACMARNVDLVIRGSSKEVTIILHEHATLHGQAGKRINARKKNYVRFLETAFDEAQAQKLIRPVNSTLAAFSLLGTVLWTYKWYRPDGALSADAIAEGMVDLFFNGLKPKGRA